MWLSLNRGSMPLEKRVKNVYLFTNGNLATFNYEDEQVPELQGPYSIDIHKRILLEAIDDCEFKGFHVLPIGFISHAKEWSDYFKGKNLSWDEIKQL